CGQRLYHSCLSCSKSIPVSDSVCVECGGDPHKSVDDSRSGIFDEDEAVPGSHRESGTFWNTKLDIYAAKAKESRAKLDFNEAITSLETAMLINPASPRLQEEMDAVKGMVRKQELARFIEQGMIGYYRKNWKQAFNGYKRVIRMIDDSHPMYSDVATYYRESKQHAKKKLMVSLVILVIILITGGAFYVPVALEQRTRSRAHAALKTLESETMGKEPAAFRQAFTRAKALREEYKEYPKLSQQADAVGSRLRGAYREMAQAAFDAAVGLRGDSKWEEAITGLKDLGGAFPDIEVEELACMGEIAGRISEYEECIRARDDLSARQEAARGYLGELEELVGSGHYLASQEKEAIIKKQLAWNVAVLSAEETARFEAGTVKIKEIMQRVESAADRIRGLTSVGRFDEAEARIAQAAETFSKTDLIARFKELAQANTKADTEAKAKYDRAKSLRRRGKFDDALEELAALKKQYPKMSQIRNIEQIEKNIRAYVKDGRKTLSEIDELLAAGRTEAAHKLTKYALKEYGLLPDVKMLQIPVLIRTRPGRATVSSGTEKRGDTPLTIMLRPGSTKELKFAKRGFLSIAATVDTTSWSLMVPLEKTTLWPPVELNGKVRTRPVLNGNLVIIPVGTGLMAYNCKTGKISWEVTLYEAKKVKPLFDGKGGEVFVGKNDYWDLTGAPVLYGENVVIGGRDGKIYYVNPRTGAITKVLPDRMAKQGYGGIAGGVFIKRIPMLRNEEVAFFGNLDKHLYAVPIQNGKVRWRAAFETDSFTTTYVNDRGVWVGTGDGKLALCSFLNGMVVSEKQIGFLPLFDPVTADEGVMAASRSGHVTMLQKDFSTMWEKNLEEPLTGMPLVAGGMVYCPGRKRICIALRAADGKTVWGPQIGAAASSSPLRAGNKLFIGSEDKFLYCLSATDGSIAWKYEIGGQARHMRVKGDTLIVVTDNGKIYTFVIEI
ncbi:PQQ-binding-like beta-propeller repeat protein, partial [Planctomycetota bacterium]